MARIIISESIAVETTVVGTQPGLIPETLLPNDVPPLTPQDIIDALGEALDGSQPDLFIEDALSPPFGRSWRYDFLDFKWERPGQGQGPSETLGLETLTQWVYKCLITDRGAHPIHPPGYGMVRPFDAVSEAMSGVPFESLQSRVTDALIYHPRITDVRDFDVVSDDPDDEVIEISFTVVLDDDTLLPLSTNVLG